MKILLLIPNLGRGGAQQVFRQQLKYLSDSFNVTGCVFNWDEAFPDDKQKNIFSLEVPEGKSIVGKIYNFILRINRLRKLKKELGVSVTISHLEGADYVNLLSQTQDRIIYWIHGTKEYDENISGVLGFLRKKFFLPALFKRADRIVTVSNGIANELEKNFDGVTVIKTIYNGFDLGKIQEMSIEPLDAEFSNLFRQNRIVITHCRLSRQKNLHALLSIYRGLKNQSAVKLVIVGDGELREELLAFCSQLELKSWTCWENKPIDLSSNVYFLGQQQNPFRFLRPSAVYLMTSGWEGFPLALCEAMACGLPVITTDCFTGPREIIAKGIDLEQPVKIPYHTNYGVLMPLANVSQPQAMKHWIEEIEKLLSGIDTNSGSNLAGITRIKEFAISESMQQTVNLVREISA